MLSTKDEKSVTEKKKEILAEMKRFHQPTFDSLKIANPFFICKLAYKAPGKEEQVVALFLSEINKGVDVYMEFGDSMYAPQDPERRLYLYRYNPHFETEYEMVNSGGIVRYLVPVSDLVHVKNNPPEDVAVNVATPELQNAFSSSAAAIDDDLPLKDATVRDLLAVLHGKPVSKKDWLNQIINQNINK